MLACTAPPAKFQQQQITSHLPVATNRSSRTAVLVFLHPLLLLLLLQLNPAGQLYNLNSKYGNKQDLEELVAAINEKGMFPVADIVINHR